jgi:hypothetical protein
MLQGTVKKMQGGGVVLYPQPILYDIGYKSNLSDGKFTLCANECLVVFNGFLARMLLLLVVGTCTTHLAFSIMLVLMHVVRLIIVRNMAG